MEKINSFINIVLNYPKCNALKTVITQFKYLDSAVCASLVISS